MEGFLSDPWDQYISSGIKPEEFSDLSRTLDFKPLNYQALLDAGAIRITDPSGKKEDGFSLVSRWNDLHPSGSTLGWADRPESYKMALDALSADNGALYNGKYRQILWSAKQLGLTPDQVFMQQPLQPSGLLGR